MSYDVSVYSSKKSHVNFCTKFGKSGQSGGQKDIQHVYTYEISKHDAEGVKIKVVGFNFFLMEHFSK